MTEEKFALIEIYIDNERVEARPIAWEEDEPTEYMTTCPKCAQMTEFITDDIKIRDDRSIVKCSECDAGAKEWSLIEVDTTKEVTEETEVAEIVPTPASAVETDESDFARDPIAAGVYVDPDIA